MDSMVEVPEAELGWKASAEKPHERMLACEASLQMIVFDFSGNTPVG